MTARWERLAALTGVVAVVLAGVFVIESVSPEDEKSPEQLLGLVVVPIGWAFLLFGLPLWVLLASLLLYARGAAAPAATAPGA